MPNATDATDTENGCFRAFKACALPSSVLQIAFDRTTTRPKQNLAGITLCDADNQQTKPANQ